MSDSGRQIGDSREEQYVPPVRTPQNPTACRVRNGFAALGCMIAYATPVRVRLPAGSLVIDVQGGKLKLSRLAAIEYHSGGYGGSGANWLTLDDGGCVEANDAVRVGD